MEAAEPSLRFTVWDEDTCGNKEWPSLNRELPSLNKERPSLNKEGPGLNKERPGLNKERPSLNKAGVITLVLSNVIGSPLFPYDICERSSCVLK